nr:MAG TPA: terminase small subunit [Caudoviricetes sp.]
MAGRHPSVVPDKTKLNRSNEEIAARQENMPVYERQDFIAPKTLTREEKKVWNWLVSVFRETANCRVSDADVHLMELYCRAKVATDEADAALKEDNRAYITVEAGEDMHGNTKYQVKANPNIKKRNDNAALCIKLFDQLGLSPLARAKAGLNAANAKKSVDIFSGLMNRTDE